MIDFDPTVDLKVKQQTFCREYAVHGETKKAAMAAGYAKGGARHYGHELLKDPRIRAYVQQLRDEASERCNLTLDSVTYRLLNIYEEAMEKSDLAQANKSVEMQLKMLGALQNTSQVHVHGVADRKTLEGQIERFAAIVGEPVET